MRRNIDTVRIPFKAFLSNTFTSSTQLLLTPTITPRLTAIADDYDEYRFEKLRFRVRDSSGATGHQMACYIPGIVDTPPSNLAQIGEVLNTVGVTTGETVPSQWADIPKGVLSGMHNWYKSVAGAPAAAEEQQGVVCLVETSAGSVNQVLEIEGICAFRSAISAANTPLERALAQRRREKARIVALLASTDTPVKKP